MLPNVPHKCEMIKIIEFHTSNMFYGYTEINKV